MKKFLDDVDSLANGILVVFINSDKFNCKFTIENPSITEFEKEYVISGFDDTEVVINKNCSVEKINIDDSVTYEFKEDRFILNIWLNNKS